jgi:hypothetical protein
VARKFSAIDDWETFVPDIDDERELYEENPEEAFTCEVRYLTAREVKEYDRVFRKARHESQIANLAEQYAKKIFCENIRNVRNYAPEGVELKTSEEVYDHGEPHVINKISEAIKDRSRLEAGLAKKLSSGSDSSYSHPRSKGAGVAQDVTPQSTQTTKATDPLTTPKNVSPMPSNAAKEIVTTNRTKTLAGSGRQGSGDARKVS